MKIPRKSTKRIPRNSVGHEKCTGEELVAGLVGLRQTSRDTIKEVTQ